MGKGEFDIKLSMSAGEFPVDPNEFRPPSMGHLDTIKEGMIPAVEEPSPWNFGDLPVYDSNVVWYPLECLTGAYFYEVTIFRIQMLVYTEILTCRNIKKSPFMTTC